MCSDKFDLFIMTMYIFLFHRNIRASEAVVEIAYTASVLPDVECNDIL